MTLVVDASLAIPACLADDGFAGLPDRDLVAPSLMWSEALSGLRTLAWRGQITEADAAAARQSLARCPVRRLEDDRLAAEAWSVSCQLGWAKTYARTAPCCRRHDNRCNARGWQPLGATRG